MKNRAKRLATWVLLLSLMMTIAPIAVSAYTPEVDGIVIDLEDLDVCARHL